MNTSVINPECLGFVDLSNSQWNKTKNSSGSGGAFYKVFIEGSPNKYYKMSDYNDILGVFGHGHEAVNEAIVSNLLDILDFTHVHYGLIKAKVNINGNTFITDVCVSEDFRGVGCSKMAFDKYIQCIGEKPSKSFEILLSNFDIKFVNEYLVTDYLIFNRDRHFANIEVIHKDNTIALSPIYDNGTSLLFSTYDKQLDIIDFTENKLYVTRPAQTLTGHYDVAEGIKYVNKDFISNLPDSIEITKDKLFQGITTEISNFLQDGIYEFLKKRYHKLKEGIKYDI